MRKCWLLAALVALVAGISAGIGLRSEGTVLGSSEPGGDRPKARGEAAAPPEVVSAASAEAGKRRPRASKPHRRSPFTLRPAPARFPVHVEFARDREPRAGLLFDVDTGEVLWQRHPGRRLPIASLTKMLTALIVVERHRPGEAVAITPQALAYEGSGVGVLRRASGCGSRPCSRACCWSRETTRRSRSLSTTRAAWGSSWTA